MKDNGKTFAHTFTAPNALVAHPMDISQQISIAEHAENGSEWAQQLQEAHGFSEMKKNDKAASLRARAMGKRAAELGQSWNITDIPQNEKLHITVYAELFKRLKTEAIEVTPDYGNTVIFDVVPVLTAVNGISQSSSELGYNSVGEVVETAITILRAEQAKENGGKLVIFGQMCAQYDSGASHDQESFNRDLVKKLDPQKVTTAFAPMRHIIDAVENHGISVHVVTPQVSENPQLMLAMVPATVWSYIDSGRASDMLVSLGQHTRELPPLIQDSLGVEETTARSHEAPSYSDVLTNGHNIVERTMEIASLFGQAISLKDKSLLFADPQTTDKQWMKLSISDLRSFNAEMKHFDGFYENIIQRGKDIYGWTDEDITIYKNLLFPLFEPNWGAVDDTAKFYSREVARRAQTQSEDWKRNINYAKEIPGLLADPKFYPDVPADYRQAKAEELLRWVENIANLEIGGRAIFNVALYAAMGEALGKYEEGADVAMMWPIEEDRDRFAIEAMTRAYMLKVPTAKALPCVYPGKNLRQPFGI